MLMSSNRFTSCSRKPPAGSKSVNDAFDVAILGMAIDSQPSFRRSAPRLLARRENAPIDDAFQGPLPEANLIFLRRPARCHLTKRT